MDKIEKDCTHLFELEAEGFITAVYRELLEREPDNEGFADILRNIYKGMPKEAVVYQIASSVEFAGRFKIKNLDNFKKINKKYTIKDNIKKLPVIGWLIKFNKLPEMIINFRMMEVDLVIREKNLQEKLSVIETKQKENEENSDWIKRTITELSVKADVLDRNENENIDWVKRTVTELSEKADALDKNGNENIDWVKRTVTELSEKVDALDKNGNENIDWVKKIVTELSVKVDALNGYIVVLDKNENENTDWVKRIVTELSVKVDALNEYIAAMNKNENENIDWVKATITELSEKEDFINQNIAVLTDDIEKIPKFNDINKIFDNLNHTNNIQRIIDKRILPVNNLEEIQAELITHLNDKDDEFDMYNKLPIENLVSYVEGRTITAAHYSQLFNKYVNKKEVSVVEAVGIEPSLLPDACYDKDTLIISNPTLAALVLVSHSLLNEISKNIKQKLILVLRPQSLPIQNIIWEGFSYEEFIDNKRSFRWAQENNGFWRIKLFNTLELPINVSLKWLSYSLCGTGQLEVFCCGEKVNAELDKYVEFRLDVILQPGNNYIDFNFSGSVKTPSDSDDRILAFAVVDFSCLYNNINMNSNIVFNDNNMLLSDKYIRATLHKYGFYDINSTVYANHGMYKHELKKTRYQYISGTSIYRVINQDDKYVLKSDEIICYNACRFRCTDNK